jgi:hypothetical protein
MTKQVLIACLTAWFGLMTFNSFAAERDKNKAGISPLTAEQIGLIRAWIDQSAK